LLSRIAGVWHAARRFALGSGNVKQQAPERQSLAACTAAGRGFDGSTEMEIT
jgi:hypothetical protein